MNRKILAKGINLAIVVIFVVTIIAQAVPTNRQQVLLATDALRSVSLQNAPSDLPMSIERRLGRASSEEDPSEDSADIVKASSSGESNAAKWLREKKLGSSLSAIRNSAISWYANPKNQSYATVLELGDIIQKSLNERAKESAVTALGKMGPSEEKGADDFMCDAILPQLIPAIGDRNIRISNPAMKEVRKYGKAALGQLSEALQSPFSRVRENVIDIIAEIAKQGDSRAIDLLFTCAADEGQWPHVRILAIDTITRKHLAVPSTSSVDNLYTLYRMRQNIQDHQEDNTIEGIMRRVTAQFNNQAAKTSSAGETVPVALLRELGIDIDTKSILGVETESCPWNKRFLLVKLKYDRQGLFYQRAMLFDLTKPVSNRELYNEDYHLTRHERGPVFKEETRELVFRTFNASGEYIDRIKPLMKLTTKIPESWQPIGAIKEFVIRTSSAVIPISFKPCTANTTQDLIDSAA